MSLGINYTPTFLNIDDIGYTSAFILLTTIIRGCMQCVFGDLGTQVSRIVGVERGFSDRERVELVRMIEGRRGEIVGIRDKRFWGRLEVMIMSM